MIHSRLLSRVFLAVLMSAIALPASAGGGDDDDGSPDVGLENGEYIRKALRSRGFEPPTPRVGNRTLKIDVSPYSGSYLPIKYGPLMKEGDGVADDMVLNGGCDLYNQTVLDNARAHLPTTDKLDRAVENATGSNPGLRTRYEGDGFDSSAPGWWGFCHNWAPASLDPEANLIANMDLIFGSVPFGRGDLRELITYTWPRTSLVGGGLIGKRNNGDDKEAADVRLDFVDVYGTLHGFIGPGKSGVVMDVTAGSEVWNQGFFGFDETVREDSDDKKIRDHVPDGGKAYYVQLDPTKYAVEGEFAHRGETLSRSQSWAGWIVTDASGKVVGGLWDEGASDEIPDFAWMYDRQYTDRHYELVKKIAREGIPMGKVSDLCGKIAEAAEKLSNGPLSATDKAELAALHSDVSPVIDPNKLNQVIESAAQRFNVDASELQAAVMGAGS